MAVVVHNPAPGKSVCVAYILWIFFGAIGGHACYLGKGCLAVARVLLLILTIVLTMVLMLVLGPLAFIFPALFGIWMLTDLCLIPGWCAPPAPPVVIVQQPGMMMQQPVMVQPM
eukprot:gnl/Dysnectes_brevis/217_a247_10363.p2 GENE.gnl/Dysnectes_brevis/217_a247_10363~~gnl/Dysnectes_brevis/217_a247_10363.p2  ORF type:complete len:124 (-),score=23.71 gnl/Dysnectes_brevis/217_a247_10363:74-415(-)